MEYDDIIFGRNPVAEAVKSGREINKITIAKGTEGSIRKIIGDAKDKGIQIRYIDKEILDKSYPGVKHQGIAAQVSPTEYKTVEDILEIARSKNEDAFIVILDNIEDPHNLGAIIRSADAAGAHGVIIPSRRAAGLTNTVSKASAGAIEHVAVAKVTNISQTIDKLKQMGVWIVAVDKGSQNYFEADLKGPVAIVVGGEDTGIGRLVKEKCDFTISISMNGKMSSLNASNAASIILYEVRRQRILQ